MLAQKQRSCAGVVPLLYGFVLRCDVEVAHSSLQ
jgi:hypothetical protein